MIRALTTTALVLSVAALLSACSSSSISSAAGAVAGAGSTAITANPAFGYAVGVGTQAALDASVKYVLREWKHEQQQLMANRIGGAALGDIVSWEVTRTIPVGRERGRLQILRDIPNALTPCREVLFTVETDVVTQAYVASICRYGDGYWRWATAEPAVYRWGALQ